MRRVRVTGLIERDEDLVLLAGVVIGTEQRVTFHLKGRRATEVADLVAAGNDVEVELP